MKIDLNTLQDNFDFFDFYLKRIIDNKLKKTQFFLIEKKNKLIQNSNSFEEIHENWKNFENSFSKIILDQENLKKKIFDLNEKLEEKKIFCFEENFSESEINSCIAIEKEFYYSSLKNVFYSI